MEKFDIELARSKLGAPKCEKGLICAQSGLEILCKAKSIRSESHRICYVDHSTDFCTTSSRAAFVEGEKPPLAQSSGKNGSMDTNTSCAI